MIAEEDSFEPMTNSENISEYHEQIRGLLDRRLTLFKDCVKIVGTVLGNPIEATVLLAELQATPNKAWIRTKHYHWALALMLILSPILLLPFAVNPPNFILLIIGALMYLPAIWYFVQSQKRKECAFFLNRSGVVSLDLWRNGPDAERFAEFVAAIEKQIRDQSVQPER
jgi:hypothetical protein